MDIRPSLRLAIMNDLHVGSGGSVGGFQNPFLTGDARQTVAATVAAINRQQPELVLIPGDLTSNASEAELGEVLGYLNELHCPFVVCKGNHDRESPEASQRFDAAFGKRAQAGLIRHEELTLPEGVALLVLESSWKHEGLSPLATLDEGLVEQALDELDSQRPQLLLVLTHYPLKSQAQYAADQGLKYGGHVRGGDVLLNELQKRAGAVVCFCGHNHYHHIMAGDTWLQCAIAAIVEFPSEYRLATIGGDDVTISTHTGVKDSVRRPAGLGCPQVVGRPEDREFIWRPA
ncbi:hypothetical protein BH20CHL1_BH20CHL1_07070 [soil metagenome]